MNRPVFCFPGVVTEEAVRLPDGAGSLLGDPCWTDRLASAPPWLRAQVTTVACGVARSGALRRLGIEPAAVTSHSLGIYAALHAAGALSAEDALEAVWYAGERIAECARESPGLLLAVVGLPRERVEAILTAVGGGLELVADNGGSQFVLGGSPREIERAREEAGDDALALQVLDAGGPLHTARMEPIVPRMLEFVDRLAVRPPSTPYLCHRGASYVRTAAEVREAIARQIREPVLWADSLRRLERDGAWLFVDMGPGDVLGKSIRWVLRGARTIALDGGDGPGAIEEALRERSAGAAAARGGAS